MQFSPVEFHAMPNRLAACAMIAAVCLGGATQAQTGGPALPSTPAPTAADWAALGKLPDWSGTWLPDMRDQGRQETSNPPPWTPAIAKEMKQAAAEEAAGAPRGLFVNCLPEAMPSWMLISHNAMEILFTPGRVTMLGESDGNRLRRIYTDGRPHPADPDPSFHGDSIGHWEGDTLVVDTVGVLPETFVALSESIGVPNDGDMHVVERIHLAGPGVLHDDLEITAPHVLASTWKTTRVWLRHRLVRDAIVEGVCLQGSFSEDKDKLGHAVFTPVPQDAGGNPVPPK
jgi:hypothetical protein